MKYRASDEERAIGRMAIELSGSINANNNIHKEGCIYATLCVLKEMMPNEFEEALVTFLREGTGKDKV